MMIDIFHAARAAPVPLALTALAALPAGAADIEAGAAYAAQCSACHGPAGVSTAADIPNLAAQKEEYIVAQLTAFRAGDRTNALMNAVAASLSDSDIENLAAHFASLPGAEPGAVAENATGLDGSLLEFPDGFEEDFTRYQRIDFPERGQVRFYSANQPALDAAKAGEDFPDGAYLLVEIYDAKEGDDGSLAPGDRTAFTAMEKQAGWGEDVPEIVRNGDWRYAVFSADHEAKAGIGEAACLACHKPLTDADYSFTYEAMKEFASAQ